VQSRTTRELILSKRLALLTQQYIPEPAASGQLIADLETGLVEQGLQTAPAQVECEQGVPGFGFAASTPL
jgi:hypothetical protein